jgi:hypothetical protein
MTAVSLVPWRHHFWQAVVLYGCLLTEHMHSTRGALLICRSSSALLLGVDLAMLRWWRVV